jgi:hypothetical protein
MALALPVLSVSIAVFHPKDRTVLVKLAIIYVSVMTLDPLMKDHRPESRMVLPVIVLLTSYYFLCVRAGSLAALSLSAWGLGGSAVLGADADCSDDDVEQCYGSGREGTELQIIPAR